MSASSGAAVVREAVSDSDSSALVIYVLSLADDALVLAHRCGEWVTRAPQLEEDVALANIGLDLLGQARALLTYAGEVEGAGRDEDDLGYLRPPEEFRNAVLVELDNGDFAVSMARLLAFSAYQVGLYGALADSTDDVLAGVAAKAVKEVTYHLDHASRWVVRLGDGTDLSHQRMQAGLDLVVPYAEELFEGAWMPGDLVAEGIAVDPAALRPRWATGLEAVLRQATLTWPVRQPVKQPVRQPVKQPVRQPAGQPVTGGGRRGMHTEALTALLAEMQHLHRSEPGATW